MLSALARAVRLLSDPAIHPILWRCFGGAVLGLAALVGGAWGLLALTRVTDIFWLETVLDLLGGLAVVLIPYFLYPAVVAGLAGFYADAVLDVVEARDYPELLPPRSRTLAEDLGVALRFLAVVLLFNLLALPLYLLPGLNLLIYVTLNGYLLGREYFELVALRRLTPAAARAVRRNWSLRIFSAGAVLAALTCIPMLNLLVPILGSAFMLHNMMRWTRPTESTVSGAG